MFSISNKLFLALKHEAKIVEISRIYIAPIYVDNMKKNYPILCCALCLLRKNSLALHHTK